VNRAAEIVVLSDNPYDEVPYPSMPIDWSAPERLALASLLHGGPRPSLDRYRVLELGCGDGGNLLPLAYYRRHASFVGVDGSRAALGLAHARAAELGLGPERLQLIHADFADIAAHVEGMFDFILAHGILSWIPDPLRDGLLAFCGQRLRPGGLLYLNYNARPGWNVRGMVRELLLAETAMAGPLPARARRAQELAGQLAAGLQAGDDHPYSRLMEREFSFVRDSHMGYIAHEFLAEHNQAYWRRTFLALAAGHGLSYVADADFNYPSGRVSPDLPSQLAALGVAAMPVDDTVDLLSYRQLHSPIFTRAPWAPRPPADDALGDLLMAACLDPLPPIPDKPPTFRHPGGLEVEAKDEAMRAALERLRTAWPRAIAVHDLFPGATAPWPDLRLLHHHGLIELRLIEPGDFPAPAGPLHERETAWGQQHRTSPWHTRDLPSGAA
jgi:SAM-dependent methyltransferase